MTNAEAVRFVPSGNRQEAIFLTGDCQESRRAGIADGSGSWPGEIVGPARLGGNRFALPQGLLDQISRIVIRGASLYHPSCEFAAGGKSRGSQRQDRAGNWFWRRRRGFASWESRDIRRGSRGIAGNIRGI